MMRTMTTRDRGSVDQPDEGRPHVVWEEAGIRCEAFWDVAPSPSELERCRAGARDVRTFKAPTEASWYTDDPIGWGGTFWLFVRLHGGRLAEVQGTYGACSFTNLLPMLDHSRVLVGMQGAQLVVDYASDLRIDKLDDDDMFHSWWNEGRLVMMKTELEVKAFDANSLKRRRRQRCERRHRADARG